MKKRRTLVFMGITAMLCCSLGFTACGKNSESGDKGNEPEGVHKHSLSPVFENEIYGTTDGDVAYYKCGCGQIFADKDGDSTLSYKDFGKLKEEFAIEGLDDGAEPQGMTTYYSNYVDGVDKNGNDIIKKQQYFLINSYMPDDLPSRIYVTGETTGFGGYVTLNNEDGTALKGQVCGIATNGAYLWAGYNDSVLVATASEGYENILSEIIEKAQLNKSGEAKETQSIKFTVSFKANCDVSFMGYFDDSRYVDTTYDRLYIGGVYRSGDGESTTVMYEYNAERIIGKFNPFGLTRIDGSNTDTTVSDNVPKIQKIFFLPEKIRGVAFSGRRGSTSTLDTDAKIVLSQSCGLSASHLLCYDWKAVNDTANRTLYRTVTEGKSFEYEGVYKISTSGKQTPYTDSGLYVYNLNETTLVKDYTVPPMSEAMFNVTPNGTSMDAVKTVYVLFGSGTEKYNNFLGDGLKNVYTVEP